jgi:uncharacterized damage-inducible protein DinB
VNLVDRLLAHDAWTTRQLLQRCRHLDDVALDREFDIGLRTLRATFHHLIDNMEVWTGLMDGSLGPADRGRPPGDRSVAGMLARLDAAALRLRALTNDIAARNAWDEEWTDTFDDPPNRKSFGGAIGHVITHSMHHRAQIIHMMRRSGIPDVPEGDVLSWEAVEVARD